MKNDCAKYYRIRMNESWNRSTITWSIVREIKEDSNVITEIQIPGDPQKIAKVI